MPGNLCIISKWWELFSVILLFLFNTFRNCVIFCSAITDSPDVFAPGSAFGVLDWRWCHWTPLCRKLEYFTGKFRALKLLVLVDILTHWGRATHICVGKLTNIGSDNGLSPGRRQASIRTIAGILSIGPLGTNFSEIVIGIQTFSFKKMHLKMSSAKWRPSCLGLNVLTRKRFPHYCSLYAL